MTPEPQPATRNHGFSVLSRIARSSSVWVSRDAAPIRCRATLEKAGRADPRRQHRQTENDALEEAADDYEQLVDSLHPSPTIWRSIFHRPIRRGSASSRSGISGCPAGRLAACRDQAAEIGRTVPCWSSSHPT